MAAARATTTILKDAPFWDCAMADRVSKGKDAADLFRSVCIAIAPRYCHCRDLALSCATPLAHCTTPLRKKWGISNGSPSKSAGAIEGDLTTGMATGRLSGGPIGCGVSLYYLMRAARFASSGRLYRANSSAPRLACSRLGHDMRGHV